jgi:hypothetical protein
MWGRGIGHVIAMLGRTCEQVLSSPGLRVSGQRSPYSIGQRPASPRASSPPSTSAMREGFRLPSSHSLTVTPETPKRRAIDASDSPADRRD